MAEKEKVDLTEELNEEVAEEAVEEKAEVKEEKTEKVTKKEKKDKYKEQIAKLEEENARLKNEYLKCYAEMENTKKRLKDEAIKDRKYASQKVVGELIQPIDMLTMIVNMPANNPEVANYQIGFKMITNQLVDILKGEGLAPIEALGKEFDPSNMQAVETVSDDALEDNVVTAVKQAGYMYKDRVLRPAMVVVNKKEIKKEEEN